MSTPTDVDYYNGRGLLTLVGVVDDFPDVRDNGINLRVTVQTINRNQSVTGTVLLRVDRLADVRYGDQLEVYGELQTPPIFDTFSYRDYLARSGIYSTISQRQPKRLARDQGSPLLAAAFTLREQLHQRFDQLLPSPASALLSGIVLGIDQDLPPDVVAAFRNTGTAHIVAISGSNMIVIAGILIVLTSGLRNKRLSALFVILGLVAYTIVVGPSASVVRAALTAGLAVIALQFGRQSWGLASLALAAFIQSFFGPAVIYDLGFLLSGLGTFGILVYREPFEKALDRLILHRVEQPRLKWLLVTLGEIISINFAVQLVLLPLQLLAFGTITPATIPINMLIGPAQPFVMIFGLLTGVTALIFAPFAQVMAWIAFLPVSFTLWLVQTGSTWFGPSAFVTLEPGLITAYYIVLALLTLSWGQAQGTGFRERIGRLWARYAFPTLSTTGIAVVVLLWTAVLARVDDRLHVWFLDVGEPGATLIRTPRGSTILIDGGASPTRLRSALGNYLPYYQREIDLLILTDPDRRSTLQAIPVIQNRYTFRYVLSAPQAPKKDAGDDNPALSAIRQSATPEQWTSLTLHQRLTIDDALSLEITKLEPGKAAALILNYRQAQFTFGSLILAEKTFDPKNTRKSAVLIEKTGQVAFARDVPIPEQCQPAITPSEQRVYALADCTTLEITSDGQTLRLSR